MLQVQLTLDLLADCIRSTFGHFEVLNGRLALKPEMRRPRMVSACWTTVQGLKMLQIIWHLIHSQNASDHFQTF
jgi:hypothetical protein